VVYSDLSGRERFSGSVAQLRVVFPLDRSSVRMCLEIDIGASTETDHVISNLEVRMGSMKLFVD
jgi:hypothetical protein